MNKWENSFKNNEPCQCAGSQGLFIPSRQLSFIVAGLLFFSFFIFMTGYFLGKKNVVEQFSDQMHQEAFADQVYTSVVAQMTEINSSENQAKLVAEAEAEITDTAIEMVHNDTITPPGAIHLDDNDQKELSASTYYYAQLIGFGTEKAAYLFVKKLAEKGIETEVKKRMSKTAKGATSYWYQVVTVSHTDKDALIALVDRIAKEENIKGAQIRTC